MLIALELVGAVLLTIAGFLLATWVGFAVAGASCVALGYLLEDEAAT